jgi:hypothetical protein
LHELCAFGGDVLIETLMVSSSISSREFADTVFKGTHKGRVYVDFVFSVVDDVFVDSETPVVTLSSSQGFAGPVFEDAHRDRVYTLRYERLICFVLRDENGTDIFRPYSRPNPFRGVLIRLYPSPDI